MIINMEFTGNQNKVNWQANSFVMDHPAAAGSPVILYLCGQEQCKPSHSYGPAIRPHYLIHYILHGKGTYYVESASAGHTGKTYHLEGGKGFLIYPGVTTTYTADEEDPWEYSWIGFGGYDAPRILRDCGFSTDHHSFTDHSNGLLWSDIQRLIAQFSGRRSNEYTILSQLYLCFSYICTNGPGASAMLREVPVEMALEYIHNNYTYDIRIADLARYLHIDRTYLYKLFMDHVKTSPQQYLISYRIGISQKLLKETSLSITEIAYSCGFRDVSSYNKHFKRLLHKTPREYRKDVTQTS